MVVQLDVLVGLLTGGVAESLTLILLGPFSPSTDMTSVSSLAVNCLLDIPGRPALFRRETRRDADQRDMGGCTT